MAAGLSVLLTDAPRPSEDQSGHTPLTAVTEPKATSGMAVSSPDGTASVKYRQHNTGVYSSPCFTALLNWVLDYIERTLLTSRKC